MNNSDINTIASGLLEMDIAHDDIRELADTWNNSEELRSALLSTGVSDEEKEADPTLKDHYNCHLTSEEINIFALYMLNAWLQR